MRYALILLAAFAVDKFVTPDKLPAVAKQPRPAVEPVEPTPDPISNVCNCGCGKTNCQCGRTATSCTDAVQFDEAALRQVMEAKPSASLKIPSGELWMFSPPWCAFCGPTATRLGTGDQETRLVVKKHDAHFVPTGGYPCFYDPVQRKQWSGHPKDMAELRRSFGIQPQATARPEVGINVGKIKRQQVTLARQILGKSGSVQLGNEPIEHVANSLTVKIPANLKVTWTTDAEGKLKVETTPSVAVHWGILHQDVASAVIGDRKVDLSLPWAPDVTLDIDDTVAAADPEEEALLTAAREYVEEGKPIVGEHLIRKVIGLLWIRDKLKK